MNINQYLELSTDKLEAIYTLRKYLTNVFVFQQSDTDSFLRQNRVSNETKESFNELIKSYSSNFETLDKELGDVEQHLLQKKLAQTSFDVKKLIGESDFDLIFIFSEDAKNYVEEAIGQLHPRYTIYKDCYTKSNYSYHNKKHLENLIFSKANLIVIVFSQEFGKYWNTLSLNDILIKHENILKSRIYLFSIKGSAIPGLLQKRFKVLKNTHAEDIRFDKDRVVTATTLDSQN